MATAKSVKKTRASQYEAILKEKDIAINKCIVMSFKFPSVGDSYGFHYALMNNGIRPILYDGPDETVRIIVSKSDDVMIGQIKSMAAESEGEYKECRSYNDYE